MNATTRPEPSKRTTLGDLLCAFAYASDLAFGLQFEDSLRSCYLATRLAEELGVSQEVVGTTYYAALLKDAGCTSWTSELAGLVLADGRDRGAPRAYRLL